MIDQELFGGCGGQFFNMAAITFILCPWAERNTSMSMRLTAIVQFRLLSLSFVQSVVVQERCGGRSAEYY